MPNSAQNHSLYLLAAIGQSLSSERVESFLRDAMPDKRLGWGWKAPASVARVKLESQPDKATLTLWRSLASAMRCDLAIIPAGTRIRLLISDMDATMIGQECIDELADCVGLKEKVAEITERAMRGELEFEPALRERVALLKGLKEADLQKVFDTRITFSPGAKELVGGVRQQGGYRVLVSGGFDFFTQRVGAGLGFHENHANRLETENGLLTGRVIEPILGKDAKRATLDQLCRERGIVRAEVLALGDGANDVPMLEGAGLSVAYRGKPAAKDAATIHLDVASFESLLECLI